MFVTLCSGEGLYTSGVIDSGMTEHTPIFSSARLHPIGDWALRHALFTEE